MDAKTMTMPNGDVINLKDDVARAKIGTGTLDTESKELIGAVNELKGTLDGLGNQINNVSTDLNTTLSTGSANLLFSIYASNASNKPTANSGFIITLGKGSYRQQIAFELAGAIYTRYYSNGTISNWVKVSV